MFRVQRCLLMIAMAAVCAAGQTSKKSLTNADVTTMVQAGLDESTILLSIQQSSTDFDTSATALIDLKKKNVSQNILNAMLNTRNKEMPPAPSDGTSGNLSSRNSDADAVMAKVVAALGGEGPVSAIKAVRFTTIRHVKMPTGDTIMEAEQTTVYPDRVRITLKWPQFSTVTTVSPEGSFVLVNGKEQPFPPESQRELSKSMKLGNINIARHAHDPSYTFVIKGHEHIGDYDTSILEISVDGDTVRWNVDNASGRLVRTTRSAVVGGVVSVSDYSDWRTVDGITVPFKVMNNGVLVEEHKTFEINPEIPADLFNKPPAKK